MYKNISYLNSYAFPIHVNYLNLHTIVKDVHKMHMKNMQVSLENNIYKYFFKCINAQLHIELTVIKI